MILNVTPKYNLIFQMGLVDSFILIFCLCNGNICGQHRYVGNKYRMLKSPKEMAMFSCSDISILLMKNGNFLHNVSCNTISISIIQSCLWKSVVFQANSGFTQMWILHIFMGTEYCFGKNSKMQMLNLAISGSLVCP